MSVSVNKQSHEKTGIKTSTFYCRKKHKILPKAIKLGTELIRTTKVIGKPDKACKKDSKSLKKNRKKKIRMSRKSGGRRDSMKNNAHSDVERLTNCKVSDITELQVRKRPWGKLSENEDTVSARSCKKMKLDLNKNFELVEECLIEKELLSKEELENEDGCIEEKVSKNEEINLVTERRFCNISDDGDVCPEKKQRTFQGNKQKDENSVVGPLNNSENISGEIVQTNVELTCPVNTSNKALTTCDRQATDLFKDSENEIFETLLSSGDGCSQRKAKNFALSKILPETNEECSTSKRKQSFDLTKETENKLPNSIEESENDIFGSPLLSCSKTYSLKATCQMDGESPSSPERKGSIHEKELVDEIKETEDDVFGTSVSAVQCTKTSQNNSETLTVHPNVTPNLSFESKKASKQRMQNSSRTRTPREKLGSLDAFVLVKNTPVSQTSDRLKDSGFHEPFRILNETSSQESGSSFVSGTSPLLFSQSSVSTSSSLSSKSKSSSPESQSSITRYFTPLRKGASINTVLNNLSPSSDKKGRRQPKGRKISSPTDLPVSNKKEQMFLDLGQKNFGHITCPTCNMVYTSAQPEDEAYHVRFHHKVVLALRFNGWKTERVVEHFDDGRVIVVLPQDPQSHLKKISSVRAVVDEELGFSSETTLRMQDSKTYMFISDKKVVGCVVAVAVQEGFPLLPCATDGERISPSEQGAWCCSSVPVRAHCGISRVWVQQQYRRKKIATRMLDCVRNDFMFGGLVSKELLAFSDPTPLGKQLAESYCGTENFLVFR